VERLVAQLESLDVPTPPVPKTMTPQQAGELVGAISRKVAEHTRATGHGRIGLSSLVLRSLKQAYYAPRNLGHAGLRSPRYCHFTSPIRRYPDLICHRSLLAGLGAGETRPEGGGVLEEAGSWCSTREREAMSIERRADAIARCVLLESELFRLGWSTVFEGEVTGVIGAGAFVAFGDGHEGMLPVRRLRGDWWELNELETMLIAAESGRKLAIGDPVSVQVERVDAPRGRVDLVPVQL
jgi:ribonuclease R